MILSPIIAIAGLFPGAHADFNLFGTKIPSINHFWISAVAVPAFLLFLWQFRVLMRPEIRALFTHEN